MFYDDDIRFETSIYLVSIPLLQAQALHDKNSPSLTLNVKQALSA